MNIRFVLFFFVLFMSNVLSAQDSLLIGKWQIIEMQRDSILVFDTDDKQVSLDARYLNTLRTKDLLDNSDSTFIQVYIDSLHPLIQNMYLEFEENGKLNAGILDLKDGEYFFVEEQGGYMIDDERIGISTARSGINTSIYKLNDNILILRPFIQGEVDKRGYVKYKRVK